MNFKVRVLCLLLLLPFFHTVDAQEYKKFRVGLGLAYLPTGSGGAGTLEVSYRLNDNIVIGYRDEIALIPNPPLPEKGILSQSLYCQLYFLEHKTFRPFIGFGAGLFRPELAEPSPSSGPQPSTDRAWDIETKFGIYQRLGFDLGHLMISLDWNLANSSKSTAGNNLPSGSSGYDPPHTIYLDNKYLALKIGLVIGGGKKSKTN